ncbi:Lysophospholipase L1 [Sphingobium sp. AP50]|uniref:rhamnogalacturonan acetylesterase n=1 Tax=Sphingobium sp. AP50 TaxID=1884369 RepID=UPI0008BA76C9|nr:rhamnogalacturonan acetylesterase [Sphingobium sp. AP50]SEJ73494.1 Lysophospholipase L1 [Sphingobium sp. AP50]
MIGRNHLKVAFAAALLASDGVGATRFDRPTVVNAFDERRGSGFDAPLPTAKGGAVQSDKPFVYIQDVPAEGNYRVSVTLGGPEKSVTTVRAELRRLMLKEIAVPAGDRRRLSFIVNIRTPHLPHGGRVFLNQPRETITEADAWDRRITLEFTGKMPAVREVSVEPVNRPTVYLLGDSTVTDQPAEPYTSWGQMITALFLPKIAFANHSESGESISGALEKRRVDKVLSLIRPGDTLMLQFGHNDMKKASTDPTAPALFQKQMTDVALEARAKGATVIILTPVSRHSFEDGRIANSFLDYPERSRAAAKAAGATLIDLNVSSAELYEALGPEKSWALFKPKVAGEKIDATHHSAYGAWEVAKLVALGIQDSHLALAASIRPGFHFDPSQPDPIDEFTLPPSSVRTVQRPLGD